MRGKPGTVDPIATRIVALRMTPELYERIKRAAQQDDRSVANWIVRLIRLRLNDQAPKS